MNTTAWIAAATLVLGLGSIGAATAADDNRGHDNNAQQEQGDHNNQGDHAGAYRGHQANDADWGDHGRFRTEMKAPKSFHVTTTYRAPSGYSYRQWHHGERLPASYYAHDYWLTDFIAYGRFAPPEGLVWVRYGNDALLIDEDTGEIVQVRYDVFA